MTILKDLPPKPIPNSQPKHWYTSKTVWFNILTIGAGIVGGVAGLLPMLELVISPTVYAVTLFVLGVVNVILRTLTNGPINWKNGQDHHANSSKP